MACRGLASSDGLRVTATGWVHLEGVHIRRSELARLLRQHGAVWQGEFNTETKVVVMGDWLPHQVQDDREGGVDAIEQVALARHQRGPHVHLVRQDDLAALLTGEHVPCRRIPRRWVEMKKRVRRPAVRERPYR